MILNIFGDITKIFDYAVKGIISVFDFAVHIFDFLDILVNLIPNPFRGILLSFIPLFIGFWFWKAYHGGGS